MPGKFGAVVCIRWRAARVMLIMAEKVRARRKSVMNDLLEAMVHWIAVMKKRNW